MGRNASYRSKSPPVPSPLTAPSPAQPLPPSRNITLQPPKPTLGLAIILDDFGWGAEGTAAALKLPPEVTVAVLPTGPTASRDANAAIASGHEVLLHLPLEPVSKDKMGSEKGREDFITTDMSDQEIEERIQMYLKSVPGAIGLNNHMGSKATTDPRLVQVIVKAAERLGIIVVDSRTSPKSILYRYALQAGARAGQNELFIDNVKRLDQVKARLREASGIARKKGKGVIVIGHVHPVTVQAIKEFLPELERDGLRLVSLSRLISGKKVG